MRFKNLNEFVEYITSIECNLNEFDITFTKVETPIEKPSMVTEGDVGIRSFSDAPTIRAQFDESITENILYVESYQSVPLSCSTGKVNLLGRTIYTNICESEENSPVIYLNVSLNEQDYKNVPFKLISSPTKDSEYIMVLNPKTLATDE